MPTKSFIGLVLNNKKYKKKKFFFQLKKNTILSEFSFVAYHDYYWMWSRFFYLNLICVSVAISFLITPNQIFTFLRGVCVFEEIIIIIVYL